MAGFADGIKSGFGLVNDVYDRRSKDNYREESLKLESESLADSRANTKFNQDLATAKDRRDGNDATQSILDRQQANEASKNKIANDGVTRDMAQAGLARDKVLDDNAATDRDVAQAKITRQAYDKEIGILATRLSTFKPETDEEYAQFAADFKRVAEHPSIGKWFTGSFDPLTKFEDQAVLKEIQNLSAGAEINNDVIINGVNKLIGQSSEYQNGITITEETHPKAPERFRGMKIVGTEVHALNMGDKDGNDDGAKVNADVAVTLVDGKGQQYTYIAAMTEKRSGQGSPVDLTVLGLMQAFAMKTQFAGHMETARPALIEAMKRGSYSDENGNLDNNKFVEAKNAAAAQMIQDVKDKDMLNDPIAAGSSVTWGQYIKTDDFNQYVESKLLMPSTEVTSTRNETRYTLNIMRDTNEIKKIDRLRKERGEQPLTDREVLVASTYFDSTQDGEVKVDGSKEWKAFNNDMGYGPRFKGGIGQNNNYSFQEINQMVKANKE
tara:strand:- start:773 stop:2260 length:1488 start_codon:yes stop_codon:yes gene_type:complete